MKTAEEIIRLHLNCTCDEIYKSRRMTDPTCFLCEYKSEIELMMAVYATQEVKKHLEIASNKVTLKESIKNSAFYDTIDKESITEIEINLT